MSNKRENETLVAYVTMKTRSSLSIHKDLQKLSLTTIDQFRPDPKHLDRVVKILIEAGFKIVARTRVGISFSGAKRRFEEEFKAEIVRNEMKPKETGRPQRRVTYYKSSPEFMMNPKLEPYTESVHLAGPAVYFESANPPDPPPPYYYLNVLTDVPRLLNVHSGGLTGAGVCASMVDSGFYKHSHYLSQNYTIKNIRNVDDIDPPDTIGLDVNKDEFGHGTAMAANLLAVARGCTFSFVKCEGLRPGDDSSQSFPVAGFMAAVQHQTPKIITCSWGVFITADRDQVTLEAVEAVANGIVVLFAAGNKGSGENSGNGIPITHPNIISVGGAYPKQKGGFEASNFANSYDSVIYTSPQRHCPDVVGLVGKKPLPAALIMLPTQPGSIMDRIFAPGDGTERGDGWVVTSGTSAATPQVAGAAPLLLQKHPALPPMAVRNILENSARYVLKGSSATHPPTEIGWDPATGFGLIDVEAAINFLDANQFSPYIRKSVKDNGTEPVTAASLGSSPDIIVRSQQVDPRWDELGQTVKHRFDLCGKVESGQDNYIYLRVQNRGALTGDCTATVYFIDLRQVPDPAAWTKIGQLNITKLAPGEFRVVDPLIWPVRQVPASGQYYIIVISDSLGSPPPDLTNIHSLDDLNNRVPNIKIAGLKIDVADIIP